MSKYYVTMTDTFMSGWGKAEGKTNKYVIECDNLTEAGIVEENARHRSEMKYINVANKKPNYSASKYIVSFATKETASNWFIPNYFKKK